MVTSIYSLCSQDEDNNDEDKCANKDEDGQSDEDPPVGGAAAEASRCCHIAKLKTADSRFLH